MNQAPLYLENSASLVMAFGYWPWFHDANVKLFAYSEKEDGEIRLTMHGWEMSGEIDEYGHIRLSKHHLVRFVFLGITDPDLSQFIPQNILFHLGFSSPEQFADEGRFKVDLDSALGGDLCGSFYARSGSVIEVTACDPKGNPV